MSRVMKSFTTVEAMAFTVLEAADYLRISRTTIYRLFNDGSLPRARVGGRTLVRRADCDALLARSIRAA